jgi:hypothetical protein
MKFTLVNNTNSENESSYFTERVLCHPRENDLLEYLNRFELFRFSTFCHFTPVAYSNVIFITIFKNHQLGLYKKHSNYPFYLVQNALKTYF